MDDSNKSPIRGAQQNNKCNKICFILVLKLFNIAKGQSLPRRYLYTDAITDNAQKQNSFLLR